MKSVHAIQMARIARVVVEGIASFTETVRACHSTKLCVEISGENQKLKKNGGNGEGFLLQAENEFHITYSFI